jgi:hypothetical protein
MCNAHYTISLPIQVTSQISNGRRVHLALKTARYQPSSVEIIGFGSRERDFLTCATCGSDQLAQRGTSHPQVADGRGGDEKREKE